MIELIEYKNKIHKGYEIYKNISDPLEFKALDYSCKRLIRRDFVKYKHYIYSEMASNPKKFFKFVSVKAKAFTCFNHMKYGEKIANGSKITSNLFADFFETVQAAPNLGADFDGDREFDSFCLDRIIIDATDVEQALLILNVNRGPGPDSIPALIIRSCSASLFELLTILFNESSMSTWNI